MFSLPPCPLSLRLSALFRQRTNRPQDETVSHVFQPEPYDARMIELFREVFAREPTQAHVDLIVG